MAKRIAQAQKLLSEYRPTAWRKSALESAPALSHRALPACIEQLRLTQEIVERLRHNKRLGEKLYWVIYATYMTTQQSGNIYEILEHIAKNHEYIPRSTYFRLKGQAIGILDSYLEARNINPL
ncbi:MAG: hypothetical protein FWG87_01785 [Defluviitaleaceae bacterium]|nr:hypothetical protein [Defluviitaleaceae bacterium]